MRLTTPVACLLSVALVASVAGPVQAADSTGPMPTASEYAPGPKFGIGQQRVVVIRGLLDMDVLNQGQYLTGNNKESDHRGFGNIRAEFGTKVKLDEKVAVNITLAYEAEAGDNTADDKTQKNRSGFTVVDDAYAEFNDFLGFESFGLWIGRMPVSLNLRRGHGAFLYDSSANHPRVTSWDGGRAGWNISEGVNVGIFAYAVPGASTLSGLVADWTPERAGDQRVYITGMLTLERKVPNAHVAAFNDPTFPSTEGKAQFIDGPAGDRLQTYYVGTEFISGDFDFFGEGAIQRGSQIDDIEYQGYGASGGVDWHAYSPQALVFGVQTDILSGESEDPAVTGVNHAFINNWEGTSDTYIVEHEHYGELSRYLTGNLQAVKIKAGLAFDDRNRIRLSGIYGYYRTDKATVSGSRSFGQEGDLTFSWQYTLATTIKLFAGGFLPGDSFTDVAPGPNPDTSLIYCLGTNLSVEF